MLVLSYGSWSPMVYTVLIWLPIYLKDFVEVDDSFDPFALNLCMLVLFIFMVPSIGWLADKYKDRTDNYRYVLVSASCLMMVLCIPAFLLFQQKNIFAALLGYIMLLIPLATYGSCMFIFGVEQFEVLDRLTGVGYSYNLSHAVWSSSITSVLTLLADRRGLTSPAYYLAGISGSSMLSTLFLYNWVQERRKKLSSTSSSSASVAGVVVVT